MKKKTKIITLLLVAVLLLLVVLANRWRGNAPVRGLRVSIDYQECDTLVDQAAVADLVRRSVSGLQTMRVGQVDLARVAAAAAHSPYLKDCSASVSIGGTVVLYAQQRRPIVRLFTAQGEGYLDEEGHWMPAPKGSPAAPARSADLIIANGDIPHTPKALRQVWTLAKYLDTHPDNGILFDQIYRRRGGDLYLTPKLGSHVVEIGPPVRLDEKFHNLLAFYARGMPRVGWDTYSQISVKYRGQVVATRRN